MEDAIRKVDQTRDYLPLAEKYLVPDDLGVPMLFFGSMINRCGSLHTAIARERIGWLIVKRPPARKQRFRRRA